MTGTRPHPPGRPRRAILGFVAVLALLSAAVVPVPTALAADWSITMTRQVSSHTFDSPVGVTSAGDGTNRLFVIEQQGTVRVVENGAVRAGYFLDLRSVVSASGERGLLGLAFHPDFKTNRRLFAFYTRAGGDIVVVRLTANSTRTVASVTSAVPLLSIAHSSEANHNGGAMAFGPDGNLYIGVGDGGGSGDPERDAQSITRNFLGKILRIDVDGTGGGKFGRYSIPSGNPYIGKSGLDEIWAYGLRNPWRISFDRVDGALYIGDVGQGEREEIDRQAVGAAGGRNYGWNVMEGDRCFRPSACPLAGDTVPVAVYSHDGGNCSVTGGYVYRGTAYPRLVRLYVFADFCSGRVWSMTAGGINNQILRADTSLEITSFGESDTGELYAVTLAGGLYRVGTT